MMAHLFWMYCKVQILKLKIQNSTFKVYEISKIKI